MWGHEGFCSAMRVLRDLRNVLAYVGVERGSRFVPLMTVDQGSGGRAAGRAGDGVEGGISYRTGMVTVGWGVPGR